MNHYIEVPTSQEVSYFRQLHRDRELSPGAQTHIKFSASGFIGDFGLGKTIKRIVLNITSLSVMVDPSRETHLPAFNPRRVSMELPTMVAQKIYEITKTGSYVHGTIENAHDGSLQIIIGENHTNTNPKGLLG